MKEWLGLLEVSSQCKQLLDGDFRICRRNYSSLNTLGKGAEMPEMTEKENCYYCHTKMPMGAKLCTKCGNFRSKFRNRLTYFSTISGALAIVFAGLAYVTDKSIQIYGSIIKKNDPKLIYLQTGNESLAKITFGNFGDYPIIINSITVYWGKGGNVTYPIGARINPGDTFSTSDNVSVNYPKNRYFVFISPRIDNRYGDIVKSNSNIPNDDRSKKDCFFVYFYNTGNQNIVRMQRRGVIYKSSLLTKYENAEFSYVSLSDGIERIKQVKVVSAFTRHASSDCGPDNLINKIFGKIEPMKSV